MIYWDTSCVLKLYTAESDSLQWQRCAVALEDEFGASDLLATEMACALEQKEFRGEVKPGGARALFRIFERDVQAGRFTLYPAGADVQAVAIEVMATCYHGDRPVQLRAMDSLHLATCKLLKCRAMATADRRMQAATAMLGISLLGSNS